MFNANLGTAICADIQGCHIGANGALRDILSFALNLGRRAARARARSTRFTLSRFGTLHFRAARARARRAFTLGLLTLAAIQHNRTLTRYRRTQDILAQIRDGRALSLEHIFAQIGTDGARRHG